MAKIKYTIDFEGLTQYLKTLNQKDFADSKNKEGIIKQAHTAREMEYLGISKSKIPLDQFIQVGMPFLCDALGGDLSIIEASNREYKLPDGSRCIYAKFIKTVIQDCHKVYGTALNGCWVIPPQFITYT